MKCRMPNRQTKNYHVIRKIQTFFQIWPQTGRLALFGDTFGSTLEIHLAATLLHTQWTARELTPFGLSRDELTYQKPTALTVTPTVPF